jgi:GNAT superfamily N-acetyltransferase
MFEIKLVTEFDKKFWLSIDDHVSEQGLVNKIFTKSGYVFFHNQKPIGIMDYNLLWDNMPFLNYIHINKLFQRHGYGKQAMEYWENEMKKMGFKMTLISTQVDEGAQHFYRKIGYKECGCLILNDCPLEQPMEMFMYKKI